MRPRWAVLSFVDLAEQGAPRTHIIEFSRALARIADVIVLNPAAESDVRSDGLDYSQCCAPIPAGAGLRLLSSALTTARHLRRLHRARQFDVVYIRDNITAVVALAWAKSAGVRTALEVNGAVREEMLIYRPNCRGLRALSWRLRLTVVTAALRICYHLATKIVVVSPGLGRDLETSYGVPADKIAAFGNGANTEHFSPMDRDECRRKLDLDAAARYVGFVGNLAPWQGLEDLFRAFAQLARGRRDRRLLVVGDGVEAGRLRELARSLDIEPLVTFVGRVRYDDVATYIGAFDVCAAPFGDLARNRKFGLSALKTREYLSCGRPVLASDLEDAKLLVAVGAGRLYPAGDVGSLARNLDELLDLPVEELDEMGRRARRLAVEKLSWEATAAGVFEFVSKGMGDR